MTNFMLAPDADTSGIGAMDEIELAPARIIEVFGIPPSRGDEYKISGEWIFRDDAGRIFALSDWKATSLWDKTFPAPCEYWVSRTPDEFTISAVEDDVIGFKEWLLSKLAAARL